MEKIRFLVLEWGRSALTVFRRQKLPAQSQEGSAAVIECLTVRHVMVMKHRLEQNFFIH